MESIYIDFSRINNVVPQIKNNDDQLLDRINNAIESYQSKIESLSGDYKTNTYKRMREADSRNSKINSYQVEIKFLQCLKNKIESGEKLTNLEQALTVNAFRDAMHGYYLIKYGRYPKPVKFPAVDPNMPKDGWWNLEVPKKQAQLKRYNINNSIQLDKAVDEYNEIYNNKLDRRIDTKAQQIKKLENEYKLQQKGDIQFTTNKDLLNRLMKLADITEFDSVLEPSAGIGCIADAIRQYTNDVVVCEYMFAYSELLKLKGYNVVGNDFLEYNSKQYDKIVANVPFSDEVNHVRHIYECLKDGGRAVVITSPHWTFAREKECTDFRNWLDTITAEVYDVDAGSFEFTDVSCKILVIDK